MQSASVARPRGHGALVQRESARGVRYAVRLRLPGGKRHLFTLDKVTRPDDADERARLMSDWVVAVPRAGYAAELVGFLEDAADAAPGRPWEGVKAMVAEVLGGTVERDPAAGAATARVTLRTLLHDWVTGELARRFPDRIKAKRSADDDRERGAILLSTRLPAELGGGELGDLPIGAVTLDHAEHALSHLDETRRTHQLAHPKRKAARFEPAAPATRRQYAQILATLLSIAAYPVRVIPSSPLPDGWVPPVGGEKAKEALYPDEDRALLACGAVPLVRRLAYGILTREGLRTDELASLAWRDVDLERGRLILDVNKTDDPRDWDLDPGVVRALLAWKARQGDPGADEYVLAEAGVPLNVDRLAEQLRRDLTKAGVTRPQLFERSAARRPIRAHDLRATFVTTALAAGKSETWICDRTGHSSHAMVERYRRKARTWNLGSLSPLDRCIPELQAERPHEGHKLHRAGGEIGRRSGFRFRRRKA